MMKFTDEQIIIALKSSKEAADTDEVRDFLDDVIECINRKNAEIERLKGELQQSLLSTLVIDSVIKEMTEVETNQRKEDEKNG